MTVSILFQKQRLIHTIIPSSTLVTRGEFTMKLMKLKLHAHSSRHVPSKTLNLILHAVCCILFLKKLLPPPNCMTFRSKQTLHLPFVITTFIIKLHITPHGYTNQEAETKVNFNITKSTANSEEEIKENY